ncbi:hypothetical protein CONPUDRAFT_157743 [Coniophora puteana RWD-64-598 SS2]|uniref:Uncharacterized protein n=1 Tax=Coniophora puteana (strain RWD-64-598) TaxID=741705 RepID=A0A5M3MC09_CONPW|nr:uncharacterized protein CONPUDRAFT_157743 [Coniophora puteana RWD-64-598 SS2]EIW76556.1 hypothetical protein CONPUDRAFT_157743 [Coniophora puteana RWD-64-598 SS2]
MAAIATEDHDLQGLELAQQKFGPLLSPISGTPHDWTNYVISRSETVEKYGCEDGSEHEASLNKDYGHDCCGHLQESIRERVKEMEEELQVPVGTFQKCISVLQRDTDMNENEDPQCADNVVRIYSPSCPSCIDLHFHYSNYGGWNYSLGFKILRQLPAHGANYRYRGWLPDRQPSDSEYSRMHTRCGWRSISWGYTVKLESHCAPEFECGEVDLNLEGVLEIHKILFGPIKEPEDEMDAKERVAYRRKLVASVRLLLAAMGIGYKVACEDSEEDVTSSEIEGMHWELESLSWDSWVARGVRKACGFELSRDAAQDASSKEMRQRDAQEAYEAEDRRQRRMERGLGDFYDDDDDDDYDDEDDDEGDDCEGVMFSAV